MMVQRMQKNLKKCAKMQILLNLNMLLDIDITREEDFGLTISNRAGMMENADTKLVH